MGTSRVASDPNPHHLNQVMELRVFAYSSYHRNITNSTSKSSSGDGEAEEFKNDKLPTKFVGDNFVKEDKMELYLNVFHAVVETGFVVRQVAPTLSQYKIGVLEGAMEI
ncbi:hypothetical protein GH714_020681 [Hevea brasiliensis]|uniref:Uncharacterized protein n=1 Tax=Hevea brasiliensis TaxID=3981 RepID=A0A6A6M331_HEVBR|nr:hypothetical protein GH714_020681 [Hevea brasiliensis]